MKVKFLYSGDADWVGMYVDDTLVYEGHSIEPEDVVRHLGIPVFFHIDKSESSLERFGYRCPTQWQKEFESDLTKG